jgi:hypothetical protein
MLHKAVATILILLLMTGAVSAQMPQPSVHFEDKNPSRTKEQREYDKAVDRFLTHKRNLTRGAISVPPHQPQRRISDNKGRDGSAKSPSCRSCHIDTGAL